VPRATATLGRVVAAAMVLMGTLAVALSVVGQPSASGAGPLTLPHPVGLTAVRYHEPPLRVLLVGDSMAGSLGVGMESLAAAYHVVLANAGHPGCSLSTYGEVQIVALRIAPGRPCVPGRPQALLATWRSWVDAFRPDLVLYLGRSDLLDQRVHGRWTHLGHRDFNRWLEARLRQGVAVLGSRGARVVLLTVPVSEQPNVFPPENRPLRLARYGGILRMAAAADPRVVSVYDLATLLTPNLRYRASADDVPLRCADGVHVTPEAGIVVAADLFPRLWALAKGHRVQGGGRWVGGPVPEMTPRWYAQLSCG